MAVNSNPVSTDLVLVLDNGTSATGQALTQDRVFKSVNPLANNEALYAAAEALAGLQERQVISIQRRDVTELVEV